MQTDFLDHWVKGRAPDELLFPELSSANAHDSFGETLGDRFSRVLENLSIKPIRLNGQETDGVFHPLRSAAITNMNMRPHSIHVSAYIDGHAPTEVGCEQLRYTKEAAVGVIRPVIDAIDLPVDIDQIIDAYEKARRMGTLIDTLSSPAQEGDEATT